MLETFLCNFGRLHIIGLLAATIFLQKLSLGFLIGVRICYKDDKNVCSKYQKLF